jgi:Glyoxalase/Bleomycin resistance protein/Dioxygenase superfamily
VSIVTITVQPLVNFSSVFQLGFVASNMDEMMSILKRDYAVPDFFIFADIQFRDVVCRGQRVECKANVAIGYSGQMQIEVVEPLGGADIYAEFMESNLAGLHHIGVKVPDLDQQLMVLEERGTTIIEAGDIGDERALRFAFADTRKSLGVVTEYVWVSDSMERVYARLKKRAENQLRGLRTP